MSDPHQPYTLTIALDLKLPELSKRFQDGNH